MGDHDLHPLFSAYNMNSLGWYAAGNVRTLTWDRSPNSFDIDIVAHGLTQNTDPNKVHLVKIYLGTGIEYWIEVRQKPGTTDQVFDQNFPTQGGADGGVIISRAVRSTQNNNQAMRVITLLQTTTECLKTGDVAVDPARTLLFSVINDKIQAQPRVCRIRVEWAQPTQPTPNGTFDLSITPWDSATWSTPDIWIDRNPFSTYDRADAAGTPIAGGDDPRVGETNLVRARLHNDGTQVATNVEVTFYVVFPPGVGDNGSWTPLTTVTVPTLNANSQTTIQANWIPVVGQHTCLQVVIVPETGEVAISNNKAQENVFTFLPASHSVPEAVELPISVRNPLEKYALISLAITNVPGGFYVYTPHRSVFVGPLGERHLELLVVPLREISDLKTKEANICVNGWLPHGYAQAVGHASVRLPIGGLQATIKPRVGSQVRLEDPPSESRDNGIVTVRGSVTPVTADQQLRIDLSVEGKLFESRKATTDNGGKFVAQFLGQYGGRSVELPTSKSKPHSVENSVWNLAFQGHIINASVLAPADSNVVHYRYTPLNPENSR